MKFVLDVVVCVLGKCTDAPPVRSCFSSINFQEELSAKLRAFGLNATIVYDYPNAVTSPNILLLDATFDEETFGDIDLSFPVLKILKCYSDFKKMDFHDFIVYPFQDNELICRIVNLYNMYRNIQQFNQINNNFKSYLLNLSHDVYSPVKLVKSQIEYLRVNNKNEYYDTILEATLSQLSNIINVLLSVPYSSVASDSIAIDDDIQNVNFAQLIQNIAIQLNLYASAQGVDITVHIQNQGENACIVSNYMYLWRMVYNLVFNSIKYCLGGGMIKLSLLKVGNILRFEVCDTGIGMTPEQLTNIRQYLALPSITSSEGEIGFGRGLVVVKLVVNSLKAAIAVKSELGVGTTFVINFPTA